MNDLPLLYVAPIPWEASDARPECPAGAQIRARRAARAHGRPRPRGGPCASENYRLELRGEFLWRGYHCEPRRFEAYCPGRPAATDLLDLHLGARFFKFLLDGRGF